MANLLAKLKLKRRWMQVTLRTVLVLVALLCVALSLWVVPAERQRRAVVAIEALGGKVDYFDRSNAASAAFLTKILRRWLPQDYLGGVKVALLSDTEITDARLDQLQCLTDLQWLDLSSTQVTDAGLAHLHGLTGLQQLDLSDTRVTDVGLAQLQGLKSLQDLGLDNTCVTDAGLANLQGLSGMRRLSLDNTQVTDAGLARLQGFAPQHPCHRRRGGSLARIDKPENAHP